MATTASLVVRVSAQIAEFQKAFAETNKSLDEFKNTFSKTAANIDKSIADIKGAISKFGGATLAIAGGLVAVTAAAAAVTAAFDLASRAIGSVVDTFVDAFNFTSKLGDELFTLSQQTGLSVESLSALKFVAGQTGTSLDAISGAVFKLQTNLGKGSKDAAEAVKTLGLSMEGLRKQDPAEAFGQILEKIGQLPNASQQAAAGVALFGKSFKDIKQISQEDLPALIAKAKELGIVMSTETAVAADKFNDAMGELQARMDGFRIQLGSKLLPVVLTFVEVFGGIFQEAFSNLLTSIGKGGEGFDTLAINVGKAAAEIIRILAKLTSALVAWSAEWIVRLTLEAKAFVALAEAALGAAAIMDRAWGGGANTAFFDAMRTKISGLQGDLDAFARKALVAGVNINKFAEDIEKGAAKAGENFGETYKRILGEIEADAKKMRERLKNLKGTGLEEAVKGDKKELDALQKQIDQFSGKVARAEAVRLAAAFSTLEGHFERLSKTDLKQFDEALAEVALRFGSLEKAGLGALRNLQTAVKAFLTPGQTLELPIIPTLSPQTLAQISAKAQPPAMILPIIPELSAETLRSIGITIEKTRIDWKARFARFVDDLKNIGLDAAHGFAQAIAQGIRTGDWSQIENQLKLVLADAIGSGIAAAVDLAVPGLGTALRPIFTALGEKMLSWLGLGTRGRDLVKQFAASFGGFDDLRERLSDLGDEGERLWKTLTQGVGRDNPEQAQAAIDAITEALDRADKGMEKFVSGAMQRIKAFASAFKTATGESLADLQKLIDAELPELDMGIDERNAREAMNGLIDAIGAGAEDIQAEFQRLGLFAGTAFAETLRDQGLRAAIDAAGPLFDELSELGKTFGLSLEGSAAKFAAFFEVARANADVVDALDGIRLMVEGAGDAAFLTQELFSAFATDATAQFERLRERGVDANTALALMAPTLQALVEAQEKFGLTVDDSTQALIDQAKEQGIVGANMKDVNEKILDVLLAIADVFGAKIPDGMKATEKAAKETGRGVRDVFDALENRSITIPVRFDVDSLDIDVPDVPHLATGGIVRRPTLALIGERGPEAVVPLSSSVRSSAKAKFVIQIDGRVVAEAVTPYLPDEVTRIGVGLT